MKELFILLHFKVKNNSNSLITLILVDYGPKYIYKSKVKNRLRH